MLGYLFPQCPLFLVTTGWLNPSTADPDAAGGTLPYSPLFLGPVTTPSPFQDKE